MISWYAIFLSFRTILVADHANRAKQWLRSVAAKDPTGSCSIIHCGLAFS